MKNLRAYLNKYYEFQKDILLCYRPSNEGEGSSWRDRCLFRGEGYSDRKPYNHRIVLPCEVVIEFDEDNLELNAELAGQVVKRLQRDGIVYARWFSGSKSEHVHCLFDMGDAHRYDLLRKAIIKFYTQGLSHKPDLAMGNNNHMIRAEYGLNEKTGKHKTLVGRSPKYPVLNPIPQGAWDIYIKDCQRMLRAEMTRTVNGLSESDTIKKLLDTTYFNDNIRDGRSRIIFVLANVLYSKYEKQELIDLLINWYKYTGGRKLRPGQIAYVVHKAYREPYNIGPGYLQGLMDEIQS